MGHNSKAVHLAYAKRAQVTLPPLEDYESCHTVNADRTLSHKEWLNTARDLPNFAFAQSLPRSDSFRELLELIARFP